MVMSPPLVPRVSSSFLILAFDSQLLVYSITTAELINNIKLPEILAVNGNANKITTREESAKSSPEPLAIVAYRVSPDATLCCVADSHKRLLIYETNTWTLVRQFSTERKVSLITFNSIATRVLVADRTGDVYSIECDKADSDVTLLMGHLSIILSLELTPDDKFVVTADRDEKIRVSHFPNSYNIQSYCLGHREFVSSVTVMDTETVISGSGDGTIRMWNLLSGKLISSVDCGTDHNVKQILRVSRKLIAVSFYCIKSVTLFNLTGDSQMRQERVIDAPGEVRGMELLGPDSVILLTSSPDQPFALIPLSSGIGSSSPRKECELQNRSSRSEDLLVRMNSLEGLRESMKQGSDVAELKLLKKEAYDNVNEYLLRKQQRLGNQKPHEEDHRHHHYYDHNTEDAVRKKTRLNHSPSKDQVVLVAIPKLE